MFIRPLRPAKSKAKSKRMEQRLCFSSAMKKNQTRFEKVTLLREEEEADAGRRHERASVTTGVSVVMSGLSASSQGSDGMR